MGLPLMRTAFRQMASSRGQKPASRAFASAGRAPSQLAEDRNGGVPAQVPGTPDGNLLTATQGRQMTTEVAR
jgi:hypothetical protein